MENSKTKMRCADCKHYEDDPLGMGFGHCGLKDDLALAFDRLCDKGEGKDLASISKRGKKMRYIDVEPLEDKLKEHIKKTESEIMLGALSTFLRVLDITPTADVATVRHGRWIQRKIRESQFVQNGYTRLCCSVCNEYSEGEYHYCPNCGARMDGEDDEIDRR